MWGNHHEMWNLFLFSFFGEDFPQLFSAVTFFDVKNSSMTWVASLEFFFFFER